MKVIKFSGAYFGEPAEKSAEKAQEDERLLELFGIFLDCSYEEQLMILGYAAVLAADPKYRGELRADKFLSICQLLQLDPRELMDKNCPGRLPGR